MAAKYATHVSTKKTPQSQPIPGTSQVANSAGGYSWTVSKWERLNRFLILGNEGGTYYASEQKLTLENAKCVLECADEDRDRTVSTIVGISEAGRAPKNDPAVFALGLVMSKHPVGHDVVSKVCRIGTHLFQLVETINQTRGWGRSMRSAISSWYLRQSPENLAYQICKYQQRNGWSHRDVLRLCHAKTDNIHINTILRYAVKGEWNENTESLNPFIGVVEIAKTADEKTLCSLIRDANLPRECVPTQHLNSLAVWEALLERMPITAMIRSLGKMSSIGLLKPLSEAARFVSERLLDVGLLKKGRVHPIALLIAQKIYAQGRGDKGSLTWDPVPQVVDALDAAFYQAFQAVEPTNKRWLIGVDVSGSMATGQVAGSPLTPREAAAAMAMVTLHTEPQCYVHGFQGGHGQWSGRMISNLGHKDAVDGFLDLGLSKRMRLDTVIKKTADLPFGGTDCAVPMLYAIKKRLEVDVFSVITDNETWQGTIHASQALQRYRREMGINAKCVVMAMTPTQFTIADPNDAGMLDVVGFDASVPQVLAEFAKS